MIELYVYSTIMSPGNQGVFQLLKDVTFRGILILFKSSVPYWFPPASYAEEKGCMSETCSPSIVNLTGHQSSN